MLRPGGFDDREAILPYPAHSFLGYRLIQEYFTCPQKFFFCEVTGLERVATLEASDRLEILVPFSRRPEETLRVERDALRLHCTPIVNLFAHSADGLRVDHSRTHYRVRPSTVGSLPEHYEIYSVDRVIGLVQGEAQRRDYPSLHSFQHSLGEAGKDIYHQTRLDNAVTGEGTDTYISFVSADERYVVPPTETISIDLTASNRNLAARLKVGDVTVPTASSPEFARFRNITPISRSLRPPLGKGLHWRLISHLSLNYLSLQSVEALRGILELYNYQALYDRRAAAREHPPAGGARLARSPAGPTPDRRLSGPRDQHHDGHEGGQLRRREGDMYLFATVLNEFFALYASMNSFSELHVRGTRFGEVYQWPPRLGQQTIL